MFRTLLALIVAASLSGCILVVDSDEFGGRHSGLYGSLWTLEVIVWHGSTYRSYDTAYKMSFDESGTLSGNAGCGSFSAQYDLADDGKLLINRFRSATNACNGDEMYALFVDQLPRGGDLEVTSNRLKLRTNTGADFTFVR